MAIKEGTKYVIIPIEEKWSNFRLEYTGKDITIWGYDGVTLIGNVGFFGVTETDFEEMVLTGIEQHWKDTALFDVFDTDARDEDGNRYLILVRVKNF